MDINSVTGRGFTVGNFQIEPQLGVILGPTGAHFPCARTIQLLMKLARQPGEIVPRRQLLRELWPDSVDGEKALTRAVGCLRHAFGDNARMPRYVETIPGQGYRLIASVCANATRVAEDAWRPAVPPIIRARPPIESRNRPAALLQELRRRKVFGATAVYAVVTWLVFQISEIVFPALGLPDWALTLVVSLGILGFPVVVVMSWVFDLKFQQAEADQTLWNQRVTMPLVLRGVKDDSSSSAIGRRAKKRAPVSIRRGHRNSRGSNGGIAPHSVPESNGSNGKPGAGARDSNDPIPVSAKAYPGFLELPTVVTCAGGSQNNGAQNPPVRP